MKTIYLIILPCLLLISCKKETEKDETLPETLTSDYDTTTMEAAISKSRSSVSDFLKVLEVGDADSFSVKAPITDENGTEHFWLTDVSYNNGVFTGLIGNDPGIVKNVKFGQSWDIQRDLISDWMFIRSEMIHGGYTIDPLLDSYPKDQADELRSKLVR